MDNQALYQLLPELPDDQYQALRDDIAERGVQVPVEKDEHGNILDGYHRVKICAELGIQNYPVILRIGLTHEQKVEHALSLNLNRRHMDPEQRRELVLKLRQEGWSGPRIADKLSVSDQTVYNDLATSKHLEVDLPERTVGKDGKERPATRTVYAATPKEADRVQEALQLPNVGGGLGAFTPAKEVFKAAREEHNRERLALLPTEMSLDKTLGRYPVIYADPPWQYEHSVSDSRAIENQYPTMELDDICALPVSEIAHDDAILFMWATAPKLAEAMKVLDAWGFEYRTNMVWVKDKIGMGYYARSQHELLLIARRGNIPVPLPENRPSSVVAAPRTEHSAKPDQFAQIIEEMYPNLPKIELFRRGEPREGWVAWGNEAKAVPVGA